MTKMASGLPKDNDRNGLDHLARRLIDEPESEHLVIAVVGCKSLTTDIDTDETEATVRVLRVEAVTPEDADNARRMMRRANSLRTGRTALDGLDFDHDTGEIHAT